MSRIDRLGGRLFDRLIARAERADPIRAAKTGERLAMLVMRIDKKHRERTLSNLRLAFPEWSDRQIEDTARAMYRHFGKIAADFLASNSRSVEDVFATMEVDGRENLDLALSTGRGILACSAHFGNWERFAQWMMSVTGRPMAVVARETDQQGVQARVLRLRESLGVTVLHRGSAAIEMVRMLRRGGIVGLLPDQNDDECFVPWFGHPAGTVLGPAKLQQRTKAVILPCYCVAEGDHYRVILSRPVNLDHEEEDAVRVMAAISADLESHVRRYPNQYLWMHDRWKTARQRGYLNLKTENLAG